MSSPNRQDENINPNTGQTTERKSQKRKRELQETKKALAKVQENEAQQRQIIRELTSTVEKLKGHPDTPPSNDSSASDIQGPCKKQKKGNRKSDDDALHKDALQAGKAFAVLHALWTDPGAVNYVALFKKNGSEDDLSDESDSDEEVRAKAKQIYDMLPAHLRVHVRKPWFKERFREGAKSIRSNQVHVLAKLFPTYIFPELPADFSDKDKRSQLPEVIALLRDKRFLYDCEPKSAKARLDGHLRNPSILKILKCVMHGPTAVMNGAKSPKARSTNARLWGCSRVTNEMLAFAATVDYFILSGESEFTEQGATHDFRKFYETRIKILEKESSHGPKARARYDDLMKYFNDNLFPSEDAAEPDVDEEEATLFHAISDEEKESEDGDEDEQPVNE